MKTNVIIQVPLAQITEDPRNFFETEGGEEIERKNAELMDSIRADGLIHPVTIRPNPDPRFPLSYVLVSGHRRLVAYQRLHKEYPEEGFGKIPAVLKNIKDELQARLMLLEANTTARDVTDWERAKAVEEYGQILDELEKQGQPMEGRRRDHIAAALGMSKSNVGRFENINKNLAEPYREELQKGNIGVSVADKLASLPQEKQEAMHKEKPAPKLADIPKPDAPDIITVALDIPQDLGYVKITIADQKDGSYKSGYEAYKPTIGGQGAGWKHSPTFFDYDAAFDYAIEQAKKMDWIAELIAARPAEHNSNDDTGAYWQQPDKAPDAEEVTRKGFAMRTAREMLTKAQERAKQLAEVCQGENDPEGAANQLATAEYIGGLLDIVEQDMYNFVHE